MEQPPYLLAVVGVLLLVCLLRQIPNRKRRGPTLTGYATVLSRRVEYERGYEYYVLFSLGGMEQECQVSEYRYAQLAEGTQGQLTYQNDTLVDFVPD